MPDNREQLSRLGTASDGIGGPVQPMISPSMWPFTPTAWSRSCLSVSLPRLGEGRDRLDQVRKGEGLAKDADEPGIVELTAHVELVVPGDGKDRDGSQRGDAQCTGGGLPTVGHEAPLNSDCIEERDDNASSWGNPYGKRRSGSVHRRKVCWPWPCTAFISGVKAMDEDGLRTKARTAIASGKLPVGVPNRMWGGGGTGATCVVCDLPINRDQAEVDVEFDPDGGLPHVDAYRFHLRCLTAWKAERDHRPGYTN